MARLEKFSYDAYNESDVLIGAIERYRERTGHYPERALADKIYHNRENLAFCKLHGIRLSGPSLGRPKKDAVVDKKSEYIDNADRIEVERSFSLKKKCYGLGRKDHDKAGCYYTQFHCAVYSGDKCESHCCQFFAPIFVGDIFKVLAAGFYAVLFSKTPLNEQTLIKLLSAFNERSIYQ